MPNDTPQQANMFTGDWETKRTRAPKPQQTAMFTLRETFEFGAKAHPKFAEGGTPPLQLVREDVRTLEEIECDLMREAEKLTQPMFASIAPENIGLPSEPIDADDEQEYEHSTAPNGKEEVTKLSTYLALVSIAHEKRATLWVDAAYRRRFNAQLPQAMFAAQAAGLTAAEIDSAIQIGEFIGRKEQASMPLIYDVPENDDTLPPPQSTLSETRNGASHEGFRAKLRREHTVVRTR